MSSRALRSKMRNFAKKAALSLVYKFPPLPQKIHGKLVWVHPRARFSISTKTFYKGEPHVRKWLTEQLKPGHVFFDVGAHHGWVSMWCLPLVGKEGAVYSFEPSPVNLSILEWHRAINNFPQWTIVPKAVSDEDAGKRQFFLIDSGDSPMNSLTSGVPGMPLMEGLDIGKISIQTITLDTFCREVGVRPNLVKIDVEGAELLALRGAGGLLREAYPTLILAAHPYWLPTGQSPAQIVELLKAYGYTVFDSKGNSVGVLRGGEYLCLNTRGESTVAQ
ncbi:MAG: FkbM family methyltransferase [Nitrospira sp.]|nr:FkbM family methyltransferase [Nitrospira sp.]